MNVKEAIHQILTEHTGQKIERIKADTERDFFMSGEEALKYGLIDKVIRSREIPDKLEKK